MAQKLRSRGRSWDLARSLLLSYEVVVQSVDAADAELAARRWRAGEGLSLGDRLCLATERRSLGASADQFLAREAARRA